MSLPEESLPRTSFYGGAYWRSDLRTGTLRDRGGRAGVALTDDLLLGLRGRVGEVCWGTSELVLAACGHAFGRRWGRRMEAELEEHCGRPLRQLPVAILCASLTEAFRVHGWGLLTVDLDHFDCGVVQVAIENPVFGSLIPESGDSVDGLWGGFIAGLFARWTDIELAGIQTECVSAEADRARFLVSERSRILALVDELQVAQLDHAEALALLQISEAVS